MPLEYLMFWTRETLFNVRRNPLMSLLAISTVTVGLFILGAFYLTLFNLRSAVKAETQKLDLAVIMERDITPKRRADLLKAANMPQVSVVKVVSQEQVLTEFQKEMPQIPLDDFKDARFNPFGDELRLTLKNPDEDFFKVRDYFNGFKGKGIVETRSPQENEAVRALLGVNRFLTWAGVVALWVMGLAILLIIHNAIRMTIHARRREIRIMELVGATPIFIRVPFLLEGLLYGAAGAILAALILSPLYAAGLRALGPWTQGILPSGNASALVACIGWMLLAGLGFGLLGSWFSVSRTVSENARR